MAGVHVVGTLAHDGWVSMMIAYGPKPHTGLPWTVGEGYEQADPGRYLAGKGGLVFATYDEDAPMSAEDAEVIVYRVNNWDALVAERDSLLQQLEDMRDSLDL